MHLTVVYVLSFFPDRNILVKKKTYNSWRDMNKSELFIFVFFFYEEIRDRFP